MPIRIPEALPATDILEHENIFVMTEFRALSQDIRPLRVAILNLMPTKIATETQLMRKLSNTPLQIEITLVQPTTYEPKNVPPLHLESFYRKFDEIRHEHFDGMIITGAPVEDLPFEKVDYWEELCTIFEWTKTHVHSTLHICWGAQAALYYHHGIQKHITEKKIFGIFEHRLVKPTSPIVRGFDDIFFAPHSRLTTTNKADIVSIPNLEIIAESNEVGPYLLKSNDSRQFFIFGHPEYDANTLLDEYARDIQINPQTPLPHGAAYTDFHRALKCNWRAHGQLLYTNWLNYYVYQTTPYDINCAGK